MATWSRAERTAVTVEYSVPAPQPWGACWDQIEQALSAAVGEAAMVLDRRPSADTIRVHARDDEIVISFEKPPARP